MVSSTEIPKAILNTNMVDGLIGIPKKPINPAVITNGKIFGNNDRFIYNELSKLDQKNTWIITSQKILERFFFTPKTVCFNVYVCDLFDDKIVIGSKDSKLILNENMKEFYLDLSKIKILNLK